MNHTPDSSDVKRMILEAVRALRPVVARLLRLEAHTDEIEARLAVLEAHWELRKEIHRARRNRLRRVG